MGTMVGKYVGEDGEKYMPRLQLQDNQIVFTIGKNRTRNCIFGCINSFRGIMVCQADFVVAMSLLMPLWDEGFFSRNIEKHRAATTEGLKNLCGAKLYSEHAPMFNSECLFVPVFGNGVIADFMRVYGDYIEVLVSIDTVFIAILNRFKLEPNIQVLRPEFTIEFQENFEKLLKKVQDTARKLAYGV